MTAAVPPPVATPFTAPPLGFASANPGLGDTGTMLPSALHFGAAMVFLLGGAAGLIWVAPDLAAGRFVEPRVAGVTHLFTLGWLTITMFGALYQLLPVALGTPIRWARASYATVALLVPGVALFAGGVALDLDPIRHAGVALVIPALCIGIVNIGASLPRSRHRDVTWWSVVVALAALLATLAIGSLLIHNQKTGLLAAARIRVLSTHLHIALVGWAFATIVGISQRLLPMFLLAHGVGDAWSKRSLALLVSGITLLTLGLSLNHLPLTWVAAVFLAGGVLAFLLQARRFYRARVRRKIDVGMRFAATGLAFMAASIVLGGLTLWRGPGHPRIGTAYVIVGLLGGIGLYVAGHFYKIVPFLAWIARYRGRMGREHVPAIADLYSHRVATVQWTFMTAGVLVLTAGVLAGHAHCTRVGSLLFAAGALLFAWQVGRLALPLHRTDA